jgi:hypothetical protein
MSGRPPRTHALGGASHGAAVREDLTLTNATRT